VRIKMPPLGKAPGGVGASNRPPLVVSAFGVFEFFKLIEIFKARTVRHL
jgi:hypothetical protein